MSELEQAPQEIILEILCRYIGEDVDAGKVTLDANLEELGIDSMDVVEIIFDLEETFDIDVPNPGDAEGGNINFSTVADMINSIKTLIEQK